jgi:hypothetical protein
MSFIQSLSMVGLGFDEIGYCCSEMLTQHFNRPAGVYQSKAKVLYL